MTFHNYKYYLCPKCGECCLDPEPDYFVCYHCNHLHPRTEEKGLIDKFTGKPFEKIFAELTDDEKRKMGYIIE